MLKLGCVVVSRNDDYGGDLARKFTYGLTSFINFMDEVYYIDWNSPGRPLIEEIRNDLPQTGKLHVIVVSPDMAKLLTHNNPDVQNCVEVLARNIGIRRLSTEYIISTNSDIMIIDRANITGSIQGEHVFHTIARTNIDFSEVSEYPPGLHSSYLRSIKGHQHGAGSPLGARDKWSLIACPGDFQLAHRNIWHTIKGFDEDLVYRGYTDSNVQRKAAYYGFRQALIYAIKAFHFTHYPNSGSTGGNTVKWNDPSCLFDYKGTMNSENWGYADLDFLEEIL